MAQAMEASKEAGVTYINAAPGARIVIVCSEPGMDVVEAQVRTAAEAFPEPVPAIASTSENLLADSGNGQNFHALPQSVGSALSAVLQYCWQSEIRDFEEQPDAAHIFIQILHLSRWLAAPAGTVPPQLTVGEALAKVREGDDD